MKEKRRVKGREIVWCAVLLAIVVSEPLKAGRNQHISNKQLILYLHYVNEPEDPKITLIKVQVRNVPYTEPKEGYEGDWRIELLGKGHDKLLYKKRFMDPTVVFWDEVDPTTGEIREGGMESLESTGFIVVLPYFENARRVKVYRTKVVNCSPPKFMEQLVNTIHLPPPTEWELLK